jgi:hypothetical protein
MYEKLTNILLTLLAVAIFALLAMTIMSVIGV